MLYLMAVEWRSHSLAEKMSLPTETNRRQTGNLLVRVFVYVCLYVSVHILGVFEVPLNSFTEQQLHLLTPHSLTNSVKKTHTPLYTDTHTHTHTAG